MAIAVSYWNPSLFAKEHWPDDPLRQILAKTAITAAILFISFLFCDPIMTWLRKDVISFTELALTGVGTMVCAGSQFSKQDAQIKKTASEALWAIGLISLIRSLTTCFRAGLLQTAIGYTTWGMGFCSFSAMCSQLLSKEDVDYLLQKRDGSGGIVK